MAVAEGSPRYFPQISLTAVQPQLAVGDFLAGAKRAQCAVFRQFIGCIVMPVIIAFIVVFYVFFHDVDLKKLLSKRSSANAASFRMPKFPGAH
jgi:hypothetical protein